MRWAFGIRSVAGGPRVSPPTSALQPRGKPHTAELLHHVDSHRARRPSTGRRESERPLKLYHLLDDSFTRKKCFFWGVGRSSCAHFLNPSRVLLSDHISKCLPCISVSLHNLADVALTHRSPPCSVPANHSVGGGLQRRALLELRLLNGPN